MRTTLLIAAAALIFTPQSRAQEAELDEATVEAVEHLLLEKTSEESLPDRDIVRRMAKEKRVVVTNNVIDFQPLHDRALAAGEDHFGMIFTYDATMPRTRAAVPMWVDALEDLLRNHPDEHALRNRVHHLP